VHLRSGKALKTMTTPTIGGTSASSQSSQSFSQVQSTVCVGVSTTVGATMAMPVLTEMGITSPTIASTTAAAVTQRERRTFVLPFNAGVPVSTSIPVSPYP